MTMQYTLVRSSRRTAAIQLKENGEILVRAPYEMTEAEIEKMLSAHTVWIERTRARISQREERRREISPKERREGIELACRLIPERVAYFAARMGVTYGRITIREQKTRWGSCSSKGNLNFNWKLVLTAPELLDYVVVHELAHRREMNHSSAFWALVATEIPDYQERRRRLREFVL